MLVYSTAEPRLLVAARPALQSVRMSDPRLQLTAQELIYAASALRAEARRAERQPADPQFESCRALFEEAAEAYDALAAKLARIAAQEPLLECQI